MTNNHDCLRQRFSLVLAALIVGIVASGCDSSGVGLTVPVSGKVIVGDVPWTAKSTILLFKPDASKGNTSPFEPTGTVDENGNYILTTKGKNGAPPGWYKVVVTARDDADPVHAKSPQQHRPVARSLLPAKYGTAETSGLAIEVVENPAPGAYDLKLSK